MHWEPGGLLCVPILLVFYYFSNLVYEMKTYCHLICAFTKVEMMVTTFIIFLVKAFDGVP